ncbi:MAG: cation transporter [Leptolyngbya sp. PLA1]|nr:cation transporter [Leptolyngbya sp. PLA1]
MCESPDPTMPAFRRAALIVAGLNLAYFFVEFSVALSIGSVSLLADSIDFLEDASVNGLIVLALAWSAGARARVGMLLALLLLVPAVAALWAAWSKITSGVPAAPVPLTITGAGALAVNTLCAVLLAKHRHRECSLSKGAFLSARNDAIANIAIIVAGGLTFTLKSIWPDLVVGVGIAVMNAGAAKEVFEAARGEHRAEA